MRIRRLTELMKEGGLDSYIITRESNIYYFAGTISGGTLLVIPGAEPLLLAPRVNFQIADDQASGCEVRQYTRGSSLLEQIVEVLKKGGVEHTGFDELSLDLYQKLCNHLPGVELRSSADLVWRMRRAKDAEEQKLMRTAAELTDAGMMAIREHIREGLREHEVAAEAIYAMMKEGAEDSAFPIIVASGPRSAYPHANITGRRLGKGDFVTIDIGATYKGYRSDLTRTFIVGEPSEKQTRIYEAVLKANEAALPMIRKGAKGSEPDGTARTIIGEFGYGEYFVHSLGHGVGLEVHEPPSLVEASEDVLVEGDVVTNEPGIYIPGLGGVRIEDTVLVTGSGPERLTKFNRSLDAMRV